MDMVVVESGQYRAAAGVEHVARLRCEVETYLGNPVAADADIDAGHAGYLGFADEQVGHQSTTARAASGRRTCCSAPSARTTQRSAPARTTSCDRIGAPDATTWAATPA